jgi:hypothetical protein
MTQIPHSPTSFDVEPQPPQPKRGRPRVVSATASMRVTAVLSPAHSVTVSGPDLDLRRVIALLNDTLSKARKAQSQQMSLATFISLLHDHAAIIGQGEYRQGEPS